MRYDGLDLSLLPFPDAVERLDYETALSAWMEAFRAKWRERLVAKGVTSDYDVGALETDPVKILFEVAAYMGDLLLRARVNDAVKACFLAHNLGADLDHFVADFSLARRPGESDEELRERRRMAPEALTTAGSYGAYAFHAKQAHPDVLDVGVYGPEFDFVAPGEVHLAIMSRAGDGQPSDQVVMAVSQRLCAWEAEAPGYVRPTRRQLDDNFLTPDTDKVIVRKATPVDYAARGVLSVPAGPSGQLLKSESEKRMRAYGLSRRRVGRVHSRDSLLAAGRVMREDGTSAALGFNLLEPLVDVDPGPFGFATPGVVGVRLETVNE